ncbi:hypothetical protein CBL_10074 [Carabus blaptoides fortunei]
MNFPICMSHKGCKVYDEKNQGDAFLEKFNCSGAGGNLLYKTVQSMQWVIEGSYTTEQAAEVAFHSIFGTYKEDLTILEHITNSATRAAETQADCEGRVKWAYVKPKYDRLNPKLRTMMSAVRIASRRECIVGVFVLVDRRHLINYEADCLIQNLKVTRNQIYSPTSCLHLVRFGTYIDEYKSSCKLFIVTRQEASWIQVNDWSWIYSGEKIRVIIDCYDPKTIHEYHVGGPLASSLLTIPSMSSFRPTQPSIYSSELMSWPNEKVSMLLQEYEKYPTLYVAKHPEYHNKHRRNLCLQRIVSELSSKGEDVSSAAGQYDEVYKLTEISENEEIFSSGTSTSAREIFSPVASTSARESDHCPSAGLSPTPRKRLRPQEHRIVLPRYACNIFATMQTYVAEKTSTVTQDDDAVYASYVHARLVKINNKLVQGEIAAWDKRLLDHGVQIKNKSEVNRRWAKLLHQHNAMTSYIAKTNRQKGLLVIEEPHIQSPSGLNKPDLIIVKDDGAYVIDSQIINDQYNLDRAHNNKARKYKHQ